MSRGRTLAVALGIAFLAQAAPAAAEEPAGQARSITWQQVHDAVLGELALARVSNERWSLALNDRPGTVGDTPDELRELARESIRAAYDDLAWMATEVTYKRIRFPGRPMKEGTIVPLQERYGRALMKNGSFIDPLRKYADAIARTRGMRCTDCLSGLRETRDVYWIQVREYLERFIFISKVGNDHTVDLQVGRVENRLPDFPQCDQDLGAAVFAHLQPITRNSPEFRKHIQTVLNDELQKLEGVPPVTVRYELNQKVPERVLSDPEVVKILARDLSESLDRHGLRCPDCPRP